MAELAYILSDLPLGNKQSIKVHLFHVDNVRCMMISAVDVMGSDGRPRDFSLNDITRITKHAKAARRTAPLPTSLSVPSTLIHWQHLTSQVMALSAIACQFYVYSLQSCN